MSDEHTMSTIETYVQRAHAARIEQGLPEHIEDSATLDFLADVLTRTSPPTITSTNAK